jgi:hypothetical protein
MDFGNTTQSNRGLVWLGLGCVAQPGLSKWMLWPIESQPFRPPQAGVDRPNLHLQAPWLREPVAVNQHATCN